MHGQEDPNSTAGQRHQPRSPTPATAQLPGLLTCSGVLLASLGRVPPEALPALLPRVLSLSPPPVFSLHCSTRVSATKAASCSSLLSLQLAGTQHTSTEGIFRAGAPGDLIQKPSQVPDTGPLQSLLPSHTCSSAHLSRAASLTPIEAPSPGFPSWCRGNESN